MCSVRCFVAVITGGFYQNTYHPPSLPGYRLLRNRAIAGHDYSYDAGGRVKVYNISVYDAARRCAAHDDCSAFHYSPLGAVFKRKFSGTDVKAFTSDDQRKHNGVKAPGTVYVKKGTPMKVTECVRIRLVCGHGRV